MLKDASAIAHAVRNKAGSTSMLNAERDLLILISKVTFEKYDLSL